MTGEAPNTHGPGDQAPRVTYQYATCAVCHSQWQVRSFAGSDAQGCAFCGAPARAISVHSEAPTVGPKDDHGR